MAVVSSTLKAASAAAAAKAAAVSQEATTALKTSRTVARAAMKVSTPDEVLTLGGKEPKVGYRRLAQDLHPDRSRDLSAPEQRQVEEAFKFVKAAWEASPSNNRSIGTAHFDSTVLPGYRAALANGLDAEAAAARAAEQAEAMRRAAEQAAAQAAAAFEQEQRAQKVAAAAAKRRTAQMHRTALKEAPLLFKRMEEQLRGALGQPKVAEAVSRLKAIDERVVALGKTTVAGGPWKTHLPPKTALAELKAYEAKLTELQSHLDELRPMHKTLTTLHSEHVSVSKVLQTTAPVLKLMEAEVARFTAAGGDGTAFKASLKALREQHGRLAKHFTPGPVVRGVASPSAHELTLTRVARDLDAVYRKLAQTVADGRKQAAQSRTILGGELSLESNSVSKSEWAGRIALIRDSLPGVVRGQLQDVQRAINLVPTGWGDRRFALWSTLHPEIARAEKALAMSDDVRRALTPETLGMVDDFLGDLQKLKAAEVKIDPQRVQPGGPSSFGKGVSGLSNRGLEKGWNEHVAAGENYRRYRDEEHFRKHGANFYGRS